MESIWEVSPRVEQRKIGDNTMVSIQRKMKHVYAIIRIDPSDYPHPLAGITVKKIVWNAKRAESEVRRLNEVNSQKSCRYYVQLTRLEPDEFDL